MGRPLLPGSQQPEAELKNAHANFCTQCAAAGCQKSRGSGRCCNWPRIALTTSMPCISRIVCTPKNPGSNDAPSQRATHIFESSCIVMYHHCTAASATRNYKHLQTEGRNGICMQHHNGHRRQHHHHHHQRQASVCLRPGFGKSSHPSSTLT